MFVGCNEKTRAEFRFSKHRGYSCTRKLCMHVIKNKNKILHTTDNSLAVYCYFSSNEDQETAK